MDFAAGNGAETGHAEQQRSPGNFWAEESALPASYISKEEPAAIASNFAREYRVLAGVASNMRSGFILLNSAEQVTYFNPSAHRLLGIAADVLLENPTFDLPNQLSLLAPNQLRNPLRWDPAILHGMLPMIDTQVDHLHDILNTLLDVWRLDAGVQNLRLSEVHISKSLEQLIDRWRKNAPHHQFVCSIPAEDIVVQCDTLRIEQALNHLLNNAVTYSPTGRAIKIRLETNDLEVRLSIADQGVGIAPEHLDHIFDRFYRVSPSEERSGGSGLGLAIVRATIEAHGGKIWADSPGVGHGATFYVTLPFP